MKTFLMGLTATLLFVSAAGAAEIAASKPSETVQDEKCPPRIQLAILLDTSNSMDGLINQARTTLWKIVNELATTKRKDVLPHLEVALYEYGNDSISARKLHVRRRVPLTDDLDRVSEVLFALTTNGGQEYCGAVIKKAVKRLEWSDCDVDLKMIVIAGNEPFHQGPVDYHDSCAASIAKGITITAIYCGDHEEGIRGGWKEGARLAEGSYLSIDQDEAVVTIPTPYDDKLAELSTQINSTYLFYGGRKKARESALRQEAQDANAAAAAPAAAAERALFKASGQYQRASGDLVEAVESGTVRLEELDADELPDELRKLSEAERQTLIRSKTEERKRIQHEIQKLTRQRQEFLDEAAQASGDDSRNTLDAAVLQAVREQAARKQFAVPEADGT